jgi:hypothetical protein
MVIRRSNQKQTAALATECIIALAILVTAAIPLSLDFLQEMKLCRAYYHRAVALELIDGEMEILLAGERKEFANGQYDYQIHSRSATNLPPGRFTLVVSPASLRLEWKSTVRRQGGTVRREVELK